MAARRSLAVLVLMLGLTLAPSFALAAAACATDCCAAAVDAAPDERGCQAAFARQECCRAPSAAGATQTAAALELASSIAAPASAQPSMIPAVCVADGAPGRQHAAQVALRTSPLRLSVVLLI